jgi:hypothetical protein
MDALFNESQATCVCDGLQLGVRVESEEDRPSVVPDGRLYDPELGIPGPIRGLTDGRSADSPMPRAHGSTTLTQKEATMELLRTIVAYAVVAAPALLAAYIVFRWIEAASHSPRNNA